LAVHLDAMLSREPGGTPLGEAIRMFTLEHALGEIDPRTELLLMAAARAEHIAALLRPSLESGRHVVCDRFTASTIAYQGYGRGLPLEDVLVACELATAGFEPDLNVLLDVDPLTANSRRQGPTDAFEEAGEEFHRRVREAYLAVAAADEKRWIVIDGAHSADEVEAEVLRVVETRLGLKGA
jgi:dTMP kinase